MNTITVKDGTEIFYKDWGTGQPLVFHHGWPLSADDWDAQMMFFLGHGYRVMPMIDAGTAVPLRPRPAMTWTTTLPMSPKSLKALDLKKPSTSATPPAAAR